MGFVRVLTIDRPQYYFLKDKVIVFLLIYEDWDPAQCYVAQAGLGFMIPLSLPLKCRVHRSSSTYVFSFEMRAVALSDLASSSVTQV